MIINPSSRILLNLILPNFEEYVQSRYKNPKIAFSPVSELHKTHFNQRPVCSLTLEYLSRKLHIHLCSSITSTIEILTLEPYLSSAEPTIRLLTCLVFKESFSVSSVCYGNRLLADELEITPNCYFRIDISIRSDLNEEIFTLLLPVELLRFFSKEIYWGCDTMLIDECIMKYFRNPLCLFPRLKTLLTILTDLEIQTLFTTLRKKRLLSIYQLCTMILSMPDMVPLIKRNVSTDTIIEIKEMMRTLESSVPPLGRRDLAGGMYSIEEALYFQLKNESRFGYALFLNDMKRIVHLIRALEAIEDRKITQWFQEINAEGLLYKTISESGESDTILSISSDPKGCFPYIESSISQKHAWEIRKEALSGRFTLYDTLLAQFRFISNYRRLKIQKKNINSQNCDYLLLSINSSDDFNRLLLHVGWFVLSTTCKSLKKKALSRVLESLYAPARMLVEDILRGVANPNIIHDEMQIKEARALCVKGIFTLYEEGSITLDL